MPSPSSHTVAVLLYEGVQLLDVAGPLDAFAAANEYGGGYDLRTASLNGAAVRTSSGVLLGVDCSVDGLPGELGTLIVPGAPDWRPSVLDRDLRQALTALATGARRTAAVCAGAFPLASTGLLDGRRAATHWELARHLADRFPRVQVDADSIFVRDGTFYTSAGVTSGIDLTLALIEEDLGADAARAVARHLVVFLARPGGQSQFSVRARIGQPRTPALRTVLDLVTENPAAEHTLDSLARQVGLSPRHLTRLFRAETDTSPARFVEHVRLEAACTLLVTGTDPLDAVARHAGFGSPETMRRVFQRELGITPGAYRTRFSTTAGSPHRHIPNA
ncbi:GlxA family transcriptional regulator [Streptomyces sp. NPDC001812]|uniref:GlxA family transcriptional regulator n=1 Tax=Streptomyces cathayae TaxID=3031124 RepID=A0ABY8JSU9_9ACTN|nr:GlxA family transcriptional regulator [Streptomyces sp. HUAS 5]WGD38851.1 GlxA family transcriptional regulator [Streptomyces sp. HUAS 5]